MLGEVEEASAIREAFEKADLDGDGVLSVGELSSIFRQIDESWTDAELEALFEAADSNGDGFIRYREFADWLMRESDEGGMELAELMAALPEDRPRNSRRWRAETRLLCMRHGKPEWWDRNQHGKGEVRDPALSRDGELQAQRLARRLAREQSDGFDVLICSPMKRVLGTAAPLTRGRQSLVKRAICHAQLCEHGSDPLDFDSGAIAAAFPELFGAEAEHEFSFVGFGKGGGKDIASTAVRAAIVADWLHEESKGWREGAIVAIYGHQTILDCLLHVLVNGDTSQWEYGAPAFKMEKASLSELHLGAEGAKMVRLNDTIHLI